MKRAAAVLKSFSFAVDPMGTMTAGLDVEAAQGFADAGDLSMDMTDLLVAIGEAAQQEDRGVALIFDEVQFLTRAQLEAIIMAIHKTVQRALPITFVAAGLPQIAELAGDARSYSERLFTFPEIGTLKEEDAQRALAEPAEKEGAHFSVPALDHALEATGCYPNFLQELGYAVWPLADGEEITASDIEEAIPYYESKLDGSFFRVRLDRCSPSQVRYLKAMASLGPEPQKAQDVAGRLGKQSNQVAPTRAELISMGLLYTPSYGYAAFTVPHFDSFIRRNYGEDFANE
jgi:hypothetical protein